MAKEYIEREAAKRELLSWAVLAVSVAGATLGEQIRAKKNKWNRRVREEGKHEAL